MLVHRTKQKVHLLLGAIRCTASKLVGRLAQTDVPSVWVGPLGPIQERFAAMLRGSAAGVKAAWKADRGIAATEFAILVPVLVLLYVGAGELSQAVMTNRRVELLSRTLVDLVAQQPTSSQASSKPTPTNATSQTAMQAILAASTAVMAPSPLATLAMTVSAVDIVNDTSGLCCVFKVRWSYTRAGALRPCNVNLTPVPPRQAPAPTTVSSAMMPPLPGVPLASPIPILIADVSYTYTGPFSANWIAFPASMGRTSYMLPRSTGQVILAPVAKTGNENGAICY